jgi:hypothetical protein
VDSGSEEAQEVTYVCEKVVVATGTPKPRIVLPLVSRECKRNDRVKAVEGGKRDRAEKGEAIPAREKRARGRRGEQGEEGR